MKKEIAWGVLWLFMLVTGCVGGGSFGAAEKTNQLQPGMSYDEVVQLLGEPENSQMINGKWVCRWKLHQWHKGNMPYDMQFDPKNKTLIAWAANEEEYEKNQQELTKMFAPLLQGNTASPAALGPSDPQLMQQIAARYYSYSSAGMGTSSGTERHLILCPNGRYSTSYESSYSGTVSDGTWAGVGQGQYGGSWSIQGNMQQGNITLVDNEGNRYENQYRSCGSGCYYFGNVKYGYVEQASCP